MFFGVASKKCVGWMFTSCGRRASILPSEEASFCPSGAMVHLQGAAGMALEGLWGFAYDSLRACYCNAAIAQEAVGGRRDRYRMGIVATALIMVEMLRDIKNVMPCAPFSDHLVVDQQHLSKVCRGGASDPKRCEYFKFGGPPYILQIGLILVMGHLKGSASFRKPPCKKQSEA